ncbi:hypothetical protein HHK36_032060 [Tetracentron sinense]|uniref:Uncharacterized protein n=1 Tax=Tetracentron sinense TaxID=13715 RepID=A0A834Y8R5_TETSI|nr:hypothetical protein HHK36_032060 [Tetracentron sinense]
MRFQWCSQDQCERAIPLASLAPPCLDCWFSHLHSPLQAIQARSMKKQSKSSFLETNSIQLLDFTCDVSWIAKEAISLVREDDTWEKPAPPHLGVRLLGLSNLKHLLVYEYIYGRLCEVPPWPERWSFTLDTRYKLRWSPPRGCVTSTMTVSHSDPPPDVNSTTSFLTPSWKLMSPARLAKFLQEFGTSECKSHCCFLWNIAPIIHFKDFWLTCILG